MKFGKVDYPEDINFQLPVDHSGTIHVLAQCKSSDSPNVYVGCAKWNRQDLKNFYPRGTKDELTYYATQFNCVEMNTTFYRNYPPTQFEKWSGKVSADFRFFPKVYQAISHWKRLKDVKNDIDNYLYGIETLGQSLEMVFLQMIDNFKPTEENINRLEVFCEMWPSHIPISIELRHTDWYNDAVVAERIYSLFEQYEITNIITDTAGRRDLLHMRLTTPSAFIRYVGANHSSDYDRAEEWVGRLKEWTNQGLENIYFFVHQNNEEESVNISRHFIKLLNAEIGTSLKLPNTLNDVNLTLF